MTSKRGVRRQIKNMSLVNKIKIEDAAPRRDD